VKTDLVELIASHWGAIDRRYKQAFLIAFAINVFVYLVFIVHQPMHNHGILTRLLYTSPYEQLPAGRWFSVVIFQLFNKANLMVVLPLVTILLHISGGMMSVYLWDKKSSTLTLTAGALLVSLYPAVMTSFNFAFVGPIFSGPHLLAPLALILTASQRFKHVALGTLVVCVMMATYQPGLSILLTVFMAFFVFRVASFNGSADEFRSLLKTHIYPKIIAIAIGGLLYKFSLPVLGIAVSQTTTTISFGDFPTKFFETIGNSFAYLVLTQPELLMTVKMVLLAAVVMAFLALCRATYLKSLSTKMTVSRLLLVTVLFFGLVVATKGMYFVSANENFWNYRYNHSLGYFYMFCFFALLSLLRTGVLKNIVYVALCFTLIKFAYADIGRQQVLLRAQTHHLAIANRILYRIESLPGIDVSKTYKVVRLGTFSSFQTEQLASRGHDFARDGGEHMDKELSPAWAPGDIFNYLGSQIKIQGNMNVSINEDIAVARELVKNRKPWPAPDSVFIHGDMIIVYLANN
jgi:hypothetical protein